MNNLFNRNEPYKLEYSLCALEPYITHTTNEAHYEGHFLQYYKKLNTLINTEQYATQYADNDVRTIIAKSYGRLHDMDIYNNASQVFAHILFWKHLKKGVPCTGKIKNLIDQQFGTYEKFIEACVEKHSLFGSGWIWIVIDINNTIRIISLANSFSPLNIDICRYILFCVDIWEHAYYLDYKYNRKEYIYNVIRNLINWELINSYIKE